MGDVIDFWGVNLLPDTVRRIIWRILEGSPVNREQTAEPCEWTTEREFSDSR